MNSFALWFNADEINKIDLEADVHFNLWNLHDKLSGPPCLDVGIKIKKMQICDAVNFYIPFTIDENNIRDLGSTLSSSEILCCVFNEDYTIAREGNNKLSKVVNEKQESIMFIYSLDIKNDVDIEHKYGGTLIKIPISKSMKKAEDTLYFRFRIISEKFNQIIKKYRPKNIFLQSANSVTEAIDFRFNDYRSLNSTLLKQIRNGLSYKIKKVHFLLVVEADVEILFMSSLAVARELETKIWNEYFNSLVNKNVVAYHWKFKQEDDNKLIENCIMFLKTRVHECNWKTIIIYLLTISLLALIHSWAAKKLF